MQQHMELMQSSKQQQQQAGMRLSSDAASVSPADAHLFQTPSDLVCPITLSLFQDPVCNALGQVYERGALQRHLLQAAVSGQQPTDPVSNAPLPSLDLVPVWPMRSRAAEYRERTIRACVQAAAEPHCGDPVKYLRRAAELVLSTDPAVSQRLSSSSTSSGSPTPVVAAPAGPGSGRASSTNIVQQPASGDDTACTMSPGATDASSKPAGVAGSPPGAVAADSRSSGAVGGSGGSISGVPGLTHDFAQYLLSHQGSQYDALLLKYFGNELLRAGCPDAASNVFYRLLLQAEDRVQQAEYLQLCLDCWTCSSSDADNAVDAGVRGSSSSSSGGDGDGDASRAEGSKQGSQQQQVQGKGGAAVQPPGPASAAIINKLADFVQRQRCLSPRAIVQMLESTHHGAAMAMQLCQVLLTRAAATAAAADPSGNATAQLGLPGGLGSVVDVMLELVSLGHQQLAQQVEQVTQELQSLQHHAGSHAVAAGSAIDAGGRGASAGGKGSVAQPGSSAAAGGSEASAGTSAASRRGSRRSGHRWRGGKGVDVLVGRVMRIAAAGTLAAASLASGNHPMLRLARVGPLLYLLRSGL